MRWQKGDGRTWANTGGDSIGLALTDTLDDLISEERINPQLAMKILGNFDQAITEALQKNVKSRLQFKVGCKPGQRAATGFDLQKIRNDADTEDDGRGASIPTDSATRCGPS